MHSKFTMARVKTCHTRRERKTDTLNMWRYFDDYLIKLQRQANN